MAEEVHQLTEGSVRAVGEIAR
ncbi:hypothetical protein [Desulfofundulus sp. TPOSR]